MTIDARLSRQRRKHIPQDLRVLADGKDVTLYCYKLDRRRRVVYLMLRDLAGKFILHPWTLDVVRYQRKVKRLQVFMGGR